MVRCLYNLIINSIRSRQIIAKKNLRETLLPPKYAAIPKASALPTDVTVPLPARLARCAGVCTIYRRRPRSGKLIYAKYDFFQSLLHDRIELAGKGGIIKNLSQPIFQFSKKKFLLKSGRDRFFIYALNKNILLF